MEIDWANIFDTWILELGSEEPEKPKFRIEDYPHKDTAMRTSNLEEYKIFAKYLHDCGKSWDSGLSYLRRFPHICDSTTFCFIFNRGRFASIRHRQSAGYPVLEFGDFDWSDDKPKQPNRKRKPMTLEELDILLEEEKIYG